MHSQELALLIREYEGATTPEEKLIKRKLEAIAALCAECKNDEFIFANEITVEFCRIIKMLKEQQTRPDTIKATSEIRHGWVPRRTTCSAKEVIPFDGGEALLCGFYNRFRNEKKRQGRSARQDRPQEYPSICALKDLRETQANPTMKDYVARVRTFADNYIFEIPQLRDALREPNVDRVLLTYEHLELILACFNTKNETGETNTQRANIRSALRKLNEFKREEEAFS